MWDLMIVNLHFQECKFSISQVCVGVVIIQSLVLAFDLVRCALENHSSTQMWLGGRLAGF